MKRKKSLQADLAARAHEYAGTDELKAEREAIQGEGGALPATRPPGRLVVSWDEFMAETYPSAPSLWGPAFLVKGGGYLITGGDTGVGKTILKVNLILALAQGRDEFLGFPLPGRPVRCLILEAEGSRQLWRDRVRKIAENLGIRGVLPIFFHERNAELTIEGPNLGTMIEQAEAELVFLDPVGRFHAGNENDAGEWRAFVTSPLAKLGTTMNVAFILSDHYTKPNDNRSGQHKVRGSAAKIQDCGAAMRMEIGKAGTSSRNLYFDRVRDGAMPFPDKDPCRMPLLIDLAAGTVQVDEREDADPVRGYQEARIADVRALAEKLGPTRVSTAQLRDAIQSRLDLEKSRATDLISAAKAAGEIESAGRGYYRIPGALR